MNNHICVLTEYIHIHILCYNKEYFDSCRNTKEYKLHF